MPRRDGTGPMGIGSMTGKCARYCSVRIDEKMFLNNQKTILENHLKHIKGRLSELGKETE